MGDYDNDRSKDEERGGPSEPFSFFNGALALLRLVTISALISSQFAITNKTPLIFYRSV